MNRTDGQDPAVDTDAEFWSFRLYVAGQSAKSLRALANLSALCRAHFVGRYEIEVIDLVDEPSRAIYDNIIAIPTLVRRRPEPLRTVIGDLSNTARVLVALGPIGPVPL